MTATTKGGWKQTGSGYEVQTTVGAAKVFKDGSRWVIEIDGRRVADLGKSSTFPKAARALDAALAAM